jgi:hypothetical protein
MLSGRNASGQIQIAASQNRFYPLALKMVTRSEGEFYRTAVIFHKRSASKYPPAEPGELPIALGLFIA